MLDIPSFLLVFPNNDIEHKFVRFSLIYINFIPCSVYLPPSSSIDLCTVHLKSIDLIVQEYTNHIFLFIGD